MALFSSAARAHDARSLAAAFHFVAELGQRVASATELQPVLDWMVERTTAMLGAEEGCLRLTSGAWQGPAIRPAEGGGPDPEIPRTAVVSGRTIGSGSWERPVARVVMLYFQSGRDVLATPDLLGDPAFPILRGIASRVRSLLAVPLKTGGRVIGMLAVSQSRPGRRWKDAEVDLLRVLAHESSSTIEKARARMEAETLDRLEKELSLARLAQMAMVPPHPLQTGPWTISGRVLPAHPVGGDAFDYGLCLRGLSLTISDVAGKGLPAAMLMASVHGSLKGVCSRDLPIPEKVRLLDEHVRSQGTPGRFVTMFYAELDLERALLRYVNAGHNYPLLRRRDGALLSLEAGGLPLGLDMGRGYELGEAEMRPGDALLLYSDGVTEMLGPDQRQFGEERLREVWRQVRAHPPQSCVERLLDELSAFRGQVPQSDDVTLVVMGSPSP